MVDHSKDPSARRAPRQGPSPIRKASPPPADPAFAPPDVDAVEQAGADSGGERVAKALARAGVASRREVERLIVEGRVALNGVVLDTPAVKVAPGDKLTVDGKLVAAAEATRVWRYHKPVGLVTTHNDPRGRPTVFDHLPPGLPRVISVGRLDLNSEGLLLLTNDGELARALELPATGWLRQYRVRAYGRITQAELDTLKDGVTVEGVVYGPIQARLDKVQRKAGSPLESSANVWISVALTEGKNREVRRVLDSLGLKVNRLVRLAYGPFALATLPTGQVEEVGPRVIREQLAAFIAPENLPTGSQQPASIRVRATSARLAGPAAPLLAPTTPVEKKVYKAGWAKPKPKINPHAKPVSKAGAKPRRHANEAGGPATLLSPRAIRTATSAKPGAAKGLAKPGVRSNGKSTGRPPKGPSKGC